MTIVGDFQTSSAESTYVGFVPGFLFDYFEIVEIETNVRTTYTKFTGDLVKAVHDFELTMPEAVGFSVWTRDG